MKHEKMATIHESDAVADEIVRLARNLVAGRETAPGSAPNVELKVDYQSDRLRMFTQKGGGYWLASVRVKPMGCMHRYALANGSSPHGAVQNLLNLVQDIPLTSWE